MKKSAKKGNDALVKNYLKKLKSKKIGITIYSEPLVDDERLTKKHQKDILNMPVRYHLIDCLKQLKYGRPTNNQEQIDKWIVELNENLDKGVPFS